MGVKQPSKRFSKDKSRQIEGRNPVREALRAGTPVTKILLEEKMRFDDRIGEIYSLAQQNGIPIERLFSKKLRSLSKTDGHHQGVIAYADPEEEVNIEVVLQAIRERKQQPFFVILAEVLYEHNLGAVLRTAESAGVHAVIVPKRAPELTAVVERTAVGAGEYIPLIHENLFSTIKLFKEEGIKIIGTSEDSTEYIYNEDLTRGVAVVMGAEDEGISEPIQKLIDSFVKIPMLGHIESLNMSVAAGICLYEVVRQRRYDK